MKTIVAMFDSHADAQQAAQGLIDAGFERSEIDVRSSAARGDAAVERESESWWEWLFGESEDRTHYNEGFRRGAAIVSVTAADHDVERARNLLEDAGADVNTQATTARMEGAATAEHRGGSAETGGTREQVVPVVEERLKVGKRPVVRGGVRVYSRVVEKPVTEEVHLRSEHANVERRAVDRPVSEVGADAFRDETIEVTETTEEPVIAKDARVVEEVVVGSRVEDRVETIHDTVRRTEVDVQPLSGEARTAYDRHEQDFRRHWTQTSGGRPYEECDGAYEYGCRLGSDARHRERDWPAIESDAHRQWESRKPGTWDRVKEPVRYAWQRTREGARRAA